MPDSKPLQAAIQGFEEQLSILQALIAEGEKSLGETQVTLTRLNALFQNPIRSEIMANAEQVESGVTIITEMNRHLRLLTIDFNFLGTAQQQETRHQRQHQIEQRLLTLKEFSQGLRSIIA